MNRRDALKIITFASASTLIPTSLAIAAPDPTPKEEPQGPHTLPALPYSIDALEPHIDSTTMSIHHSKHHATYIKNLNTLLADYPDLQKKSAEELIQNFNSIPKAIHEKVLNNAGGHYNHSLFWQMLSKSGGGIPKGKIAQAIDSTYKNFEDFKYVFSHAATDVFGSGWTWLAFDPKEKKVKIESMANQGNPINHGHVPLLGLDVWEHAYYLKYQNKRADYIKSFWNVVNWNFVEERYQKAAA